MVYRVLRLFAKGHIKKDKNNLENLLWAPVASPAGPEAPVAPVNDRKSSQNICTE